MALSLLGSASSDPYANIATIVAGGTVSSGGSGSSASIASLFR
jgi:hypothetical protein